MNFTDKKELIKKAFRTKLPGIIKSEKENIGPGVYLKIKRILKFRSKYLKNILSRSLNTKLQSKAKLFWGKKIILPFDDSHALRLHYYGSLVGNEIRLIPFLIDNLKENDVFYDIGANYAFYSHLALELVLKGEVHNFEPSPAVFPYIKMNALEHNYFVNQVALSDHSGKDEFYDTTNSGESGASSLFKDRLTMDGKSKYNTAMVESMTLDEYVKTHNPPTFIKLDVEGAESLVIQGGMETLKKYHPTIAMEVWSGEKGKRFHRAAVELLSSLGYSSHTINSEGKLDPIDINKLPFPTETAEVFDNIVFIYNK